MYALYLPLLKKLNQEIPIYSICLNKFRNSSLADDEDESSNQFISVFVNKIDAALSIFIFLASVNYLVFSFLLKNVYFI